MSYDIAAGILCLALLCLIKTYWAFGQAIKEEVMVRSEKWL